MRPRPITCSALWMICLWCGGTELLNFLYVVRPSDEVNVHLGLYGSFYDLPGSGVLELLGIYMLAMHDIGNI